VGGMLIIAGEFNVEPSDRDKFLAAAGPMMAETMKEEGCHAYVFTPSTTDPAVIHLFEKWDDESNLKPHFKSAHMSAFNAALKEVKTNSRNITMYTVASEKSL
jgi:quinol monooxygenase YgiN